MIDLRSDTVSLPDAGMRKAMADAAMGDDCFGDDPTTRELEAHCADLFGKDAALFTTGGTQSNQIAMKTLTRPGDEVVINAAYHINFFEAASTSAFSGVNFNLVYSDDGTTTRRDLERIYDTKARWNANYALPRVVVLENTVGSKGGTVLSLEDMAAVKAYASSLGATLYLDGARLLHAAAATATPVRRYAETADCLAMCFSKSLGAPVGSILAGPRDVIDRARKYRKWFGGDMHQAGVVAAGALYAIKHNAGRLHEDHENARLIHQAIAGIGGIDGTYRGTNMVYVDVGRIGVPAGRVAAVLEDRGVRCLAWNDRLVRFVTHINIGRGDAERAAGIIRQTLAEAAQTASPAPADATERPRVSVR